MPQQPDHSPHLAEHTGSRIRPWKGHSYELVSTTIRFIAKHRHDGLPAHRFNHTPFRDDGLDEPGGGDVEGGVIDADAVGGGGAAEAVGDFFTGALLDRDLIARFDR